MPEKCVRRRDGTIVPGCMGVAAAMGCGKSDSAIMSFCTCKGKKDYLTENETLRGEIKNLRSELLQVRDENKDLKSELGIIELPNPKSE